jgi:hypothetical protein
MPFLSHDRSRFMPEFLSPETSRKLDAAARALSKKHRLEDAARAELRAKMESKLLAYLSGGEKLTEENAFVLVREHFGDPEEVKVMLENVHAEEAQVSMVRRIGAITVVFMGIWCMYFLVAFMLYSLLYVLHFPTSGLSVSLEIAKRIPWIVVYTSAIVMLIMWRNREHEPRPPWYMRVNPWYFVPLSFLLSFIIIFGFSFPAYQKTEPSFWNQFPFFTYSSSLSIYHVEIDLIVGGFLWIWWLSLVDRKAIGFITGLSAWMIFQYILNIWLGIIIELLNGNSLLVSLPVLLNPKYIVGPEVMITALVAAVSFLIFSVLYAAGDKAMNSLRSSR